MKLSDFEAIVEALNAAQVRYLVAGGLAVNAHGYVRLTMDVDLVISLDPDNVRRAFRAMAGIGYQPTVPVEAEAFAKVEQRKYWRQAKGMRVLSFFSDEHPLTSLDVFVEEPFDFSAEHAAAYVDELRPGVEVRFVALSTLIGMKEEAGRPKDMDDVQHLRWIQEGEGGNE